MTTAAEQIDRAPAAAAKRTRVAHEPSEVSLTGVFTASLWIGCVAIGIIGIVVPYARSVAPRPAPAPIQAQALNVSLTTADIALDDPAPPPANALTPPPAAQPLTPPSAPALIPVAAPNPAIAFQLPVAGPTRIVDAKEASHSATTTPPGENVSPRAAATPLTFGRGEGKQPAPIYPPRAMSEGQQGTVRVEFTVGPDGRVLSAGLSSGNTCRFSLLNEAALKVIRERWRFSARPVRLHTIDLEFVLPKRI